MKKIALFFLILMITVQYGCNKNNSQNNMSDTGKNSVTGIEIGNKIPEFVFYDLNMNKIESSNYAGKPLILNFWATWCPPCKAEMPHMQNIYDKFKDQGVEILAVNLTSQDTKSKIAPFVKEFGLTFPILLDEEGYVGQKYQIMTVPTSLMIDTKGNIVETISGPMDEALMESLLKKAQ